MFLHSTAPIKVPNLEESMQRYRSEGGRFIEYQLVLSALAISVSQPKVVYVGPGEGTTQRGLGYSLVTALLGWWSLTGFFWTIDALIKNLRGGIDVTASLLPADEADPEDLRAIEQARDFNQKAFAVALLAVLAILVTFCVVPYVGELLAVL